jgi:hypothetical protein
MCDSIMDLMLFMKFGMGDTQNSLFNFLYSVVPVWYMLEFWGRDDVIFHDHLRMGIANLIKLKQTIVNITVTNNS